MNVLQFVSYARKFLVAVVAALGVLAGALADGSVSPTEWVQVAFAFLGALGVFMVANQSKS